MNKDTLAKANEIQAQLNNIKAQCSNLKNASVDDHFFFVSKTEGGFIGFSIQLDIEIALSVKKSIEEYFNSKLQTIQKKFNAL